ncbi:hypothetical protein F5J12DRAFT_724013 [Pisolithus orientalis]|uniref:uncharacterized protein n=1 Tax=Pisolithus orientalis TaxID=936130 RepID=UPI002224E697|nr:uncharacterized protein F5J12DRAFT_724013 [Pisolithus orientalis]KAI6000325.1 hypothetical protein F5J12DRAFT_724013 [Pisolithus orientalis]
MITLGALPPWTHTAPPSSIAFAPNVTPVTFNDPLPTSDTTSDPILFPPSPLEGSPRRPNHGKKRGEDYIPRPPNAFILFRSAFIKSQHVSSDVETNHSTLSKIIGLTWQSMPHDERQIWHAKAKKALEEHRKKWPQYAFRPSHSKSKGTTEKRKVREVEPKDLKRCAKIAELLVEGKKGAELDAAIQEFDRTHVPEIVTRFETPITARSFRRSSSAPVDNDKPKKSSSRRTRSTSSQPSFQVAQPTEFEAPSPTEPVTAIHTLVSTQSCPDLSVSPSFDPTLSYSFPAKSQPSFELDPFMFDMAFGDSIMSANGSVASYPCSPTEGRVTTPVPCYDMAYNNNDWTPCSSRPSSSPATPQMLSPSPSFDCIGTDHPFVLGSYAFDNIPPNQHDISPCGQQYTAGLDVFHHHIDTSVPFSRPDFAPFTKGHLNSFHYPTKPEIASTDMEFSTFMSSLTAF